MENVMIEKVKITAVVIEDTKEGTFTVSSESKGGPIVSDDSFEKACSKFEKALKLSCAIQNLLTFQEAVKDAKKESSESRLTRTEPEIEYVRTCA
jgi:hypothetical protein